MIRRVVLLHEELQAVSDGLQETERTHAIWTNTILHPCGEAAFEPDGVGACAEDDVEREGNHGDACDQLGE